METTRTGRWVGLAALLAAEAMNLLDATIVPVAAPAIHRDLGGSPSDVQWYGAAYTLPFALLLITGGRLGDLAGRRRVFRIGVAGFLAASVGCALAPDTGALIALRVLQGAAAALIVPQTIGLIKAMFTGPALPKALGSIGPVMGLAAVCGPVLGAVLTHADLFGTSWRAVFLVNAPLSVAVLLAARALVEDRAPRRPGLDPVGTTLAVTAAGLVVYPLVRSGSGGLGAGGWATVAAGLATGILFALHQRHRARATHEASPEASPRAGRWAGWRWVRRWVGQGPLVETGLFGQWLFPAALVTSVLFFAVTSGLTLVLVLHVQWGLGAGVMAAGLSLVPWSAGMAVASWLAGARLVGRYGARLMLVGLGVLAAGLVATVVACGASDRVGLLVALGVVGVGVGLFTPPFFTTALHVVGPQQVGSAAGLLNAVQQLGGSLGVAVLGSLYLAGHPTGDRAAAVGAVQHVLWLAAGLTAAAAVTAAVMSRHPSDPTTPHDRTTRPTRATPAQVGQAGQVG
jgi:MFS family permease